MRYIAHVPDRQVNGSATLLSIACLWMSWTGRVYTSVLICLRAESVEISVVKQAAACRLAFHWLLRGRSFNGILAVYYFACSITATPVLRFARGRLLC